jgi:hypothetical protein
MFCFAFCKKMLGFSFKQKESNEQTKVLQKAEKKQNKKIGNPNNGGQKKQMAKSKGKRSNRKNMENNKMGTSSAENYQHDSSTTPTNNDSTEQTKIADTNSSNQTKIADTNSSNQTSSFSSTENENIFKKLIENPNNGGQKKQMSDKYDAKKEKQMAKYKGKQLKRNMKNNKMGTPSAENDQHDSNTTPTNNDSTIQR